MTYPTRSIRITWGFSTVGGEIAETGMHIGAIEGTPEDLFAAFDSTALSDLATAYFSNLLDNGSINWADYSKMITVKAALIGTDGLYVTDPIILDSGTLHTGAATGVPPQCAVLLSMWSGSNTGVANYGRMYLPHTTMPMAAGYPLVTDGASSSMAVHGKEFLNAVNAVVDWGLSHGVAGQVINISKKGAGTKKQVLYARVGRLIDTQRRRYNGLPVSYHSEALY